MAPTKEKASPGGNNRTISSPSDIRDEALRLGDIIRAMTPELSRILKRHRALR